MDVLTDNAIKKITQDHSSNVAGNMSLKEYLDLPVIGKSKAEYIFIDGLQELVIKSKKKTIENYPTDLTGVPSWINHACTTVPVALYKDPFARENDVLVLCEEYNNLGETPRYRTARRIDCKQIMFSEKVMKQEPLFEITQEFIFDQCEYPKQFSYSNSRKVIDAHYQACLYAGILINSATYSNAPGECWSYTIGPCEGMKAADMLWVSRYILRRVCADFDLTLRLEKLQNKDSPSYFPRTVFYFSNKSMRMEGGIKDINLACERLISGHKEDVVQCNASMGSYVVSASQIMVPLCVQKSGSGFIMDGRPAAGIDPYDVIKTIINRCIL